MDGKTGKAGRMCNAVRTTFFGKRKFASDVKMDVVKRFV